MIFLFNKTVKNSISDYIPHETVTFDDRDPPWINKNAKQLILEKNEMYEKYIKENKDSKLTDKVKCLQNELNSIIQSNKQKYYPRMLKICGELISKPLEKNFQILHRKTSVS